MSIFWLTTDTPKLPCPWKRKKEPENVEPELTMDGPWRYPLSVVASFPSRLFVFLWLFDFHTVFNSKISSGYSTSRRFCYKKVVFNLILSTHHSIFLSLTSSIRLEFMLGEERVNWNEDLQRFHAEFVIDGFKCVNWLSISLIFSYLLFSFLIIFEFMFCNFDYLLLFWLWIYVNTG